MRSKPAPRPPWVLPVVPCQWVAGHAPPRLWCGGKWVVEVWPLITSSRRDHSPPQGLCRVALFSVVERKKKKRGEIICYFFRLGWTTAFLCWEGSERVSAEWLHVRLYRRSHVHRAIGHHDSECPASVFSN